MVHRCVHKYTPEYMNNRLNTNASLGRPCTRGHSKLNLNRPWCDHYKCSFEYMGSKDWNSLPDSIRALKSSKAFKLVVFYVCYTCFDFCNIITVFLVIYSVLCCYVGYPVDFYIFFLICTPLKFLLVHSPMLFCPLYCRRTRWTCIISFLFLICSLWDLTCTLFVPCIVAGLPGRPALHSWWDIPA